MILLDETFAIQADDNQYILVERKIRGEESKNVGEEYYQTLGYYGIISTALDGLVKTIMRRKVQESDMMLPDAVNELRAIEQRCTDWAKRLDGGGARVP